MTLPSDYIKFTIGGSVFGASTWSTSFNVRTTLSAGSWGVSDLETVAGAVEGWVATWWGSTKPQCLSGVTYTGMTARAYDQDTNHAYAVAEVPRSAVAGTGGAGCPSYISMVHSMVTATAGRSAKGRMYVPHHSAISASTGNWTSTLATNAGGYLKTLLDNVNGADWSSYNVTDHAVCVVSAVKQAFYDVVGIRIDTLPDSQHRRQDKLPSAAQVYTGLA